MRLMITRPREDAEPLARELAALGVSAVIEPLLSIEMSQSDAPDLSGVQALLLTSANGVRAFVGVSDERRLPVYAVGDASARAAAQAGFENVESASGDVDALTDLVSKKLKTGDGSLLHIAGSKVAGDLAGFLCKAGYDYHRVQLYHAARAMALSPEGVSAIKNATLEGVVLYSPRTAESFVDLVGKAGLDCRFLTAFCLSKAVANKARAIDWKKVIVANTPDQAALIKSVQESF